MCALHPGGHCGVRALRRLVAASVEAMARLAPELLPTPAKPHYGFTFRQLQRLTEV
jgi:hypothetical protein